MSYVTRAQVKTWLNIAGTTYDSYIDLAIPLAEDDIDVFTQRTHGGVASGFGFLTHSINQIFRITDSRKGVLLQAWPVQSIAGMTLAGVALPSTEYALTAEEGFIQFIDANGLPVYRHGVLETTYVVGYSSAPPSVQLGCYRLIEYHLNRDEGIGAELVGDIQTTWRSSGTEVEDIMRATVGRYVLDLINPSDGEIN